MCDKGGNGAIDADVIPPLICIYPWLLSNTTRDPNLMARISRLACSAVQVDSDGRLELKLDAKLVHRILLDLADALGGDIKLLSQLV